MKELIAEGWVGTPYIYNAYEQNSQWIDPQTPLRQVPADVDQDRIRVSSLEGYGAPVIDLGHWFMDADLTSVVGVLRNFVPNRMIRETGTMMRANIDDGDIFIGEFAGGAICSVQSSFVTVGNYPGIEVRVYGSEGALIARLVEEFGVMETLKGAKPDAVEFVDVEVPQRLFPPGGDVHEAWPRLYYSNLTANFVDEILAGGDKNEGNFADAAWVQEVINAVEQSHHERGWVGLPLAR
jgi:predicted dehydrogenase